MTLISTHISTQMFEVSEDALRRNLENEVLASVGLTRETPGLTIRTTRGGGRKGGYRVSLTRDMTKDPSRQIAGPQNG